MNHEPITIIKPARAEVHNFDGGTEYWDTKQAAQVLGRSRRAVLRYIDSGYLQAIKVSGTKGLEWRIVPFVVTKPESVKTNDTAEYQTKIAQLEHQIDFLKLQANESLRQQESKSNLQELTPGFMKTIAAFFMISGVKFGLAQRTH